MKKINLPLILGIVFISFFGGTGAALIGEYPEPEMFTTWDFILITLVLVGVFVCGIFSGRRD